MTLMRAVLASRNAHKIVEVRRILNAAGAQIDVIGIDDTGVDIPDIAETGVTFEDNAIIKAQTVCDLTGLPAIADDSGICVDALNGMPGVLSARWAGGHGGDQANLDLLLAQLADIADDRRGAQFVAVVALARPGLDPVTVTGIVSGSLLRARRGEGGFGYDPIFVPTGYGVTTAELPAESKDAISHRGSALRQLAALI